METLTGKWKGYFSQVLGIEEDPYEAEFDFEMEIVETENGFEGVCKDIEIEIGKREKSKIKGFRDGNLISFTKQYENSIFYDAENDELILEKGKKQDEIIHYGTLNECGNKFSGKWEILLGEETILAGEEYQEHIAYGHWEMEKVK